MSIGRPMDFILSHPTGSPFVRGVLAGLSQDTRLGEFWTSIALPQGMIGLLPKGAMRNKAAMRSFPEVGNARHVTRPMREIIRQSARRVGWSGLVRHETGYASVDAIYRDLDEAVARHLAQSRNRQLRAVYAYEDGALQSFRAAERCGLVRIYDLPIAHWRTLRRLLSEEAERRPDWACTMEGLQDSAEKLARKDEEITRANRIVVASNFTRDSLCEMPGLSARIDVIPYGCPEPRVSAPARRAPGASIHLLYAGHLAQRKGMSDLVDGLTRLEIDWRLTMAGPLPSQVPNVLSNFLKDPRVDWRGVVPHATLMKLMAEAHAFVFPSIVEGFAMVVTEAMAAGVPAITTPHTCGPDLLQDGIDGYIVPIRDPDAIADRITCLYDDEDARFSMAERALARAGQMSWSRYSDRIAQRAGKWVSPG